MEVIKIYKLNKVELRKFGIITGLLIIVLIGSVVPLLWGQNILAWQWYTSPIGGVFILWGLIHPRTLRWIYEPWMLLAEKVGWVNTHIILFILFFMLIAPLGLVMRLFGYDPMNRKFDGIAESYRKNKESQAKDHMEAPY